MDGIAERDFVAFNRAVIDGDISAIRSAEQALVDYAFLDYDVVGQVFSIGKGDRVAVIAALLDRGFDPNLLSPDRKTCLWEAIIKEEFDVAELLLQHGADPNCNASKCRLLLAALNRPDHESRCRFVRLLVEHGIDVNHIFDLYGDPENLFTALDWAKDQPNIAEYLRSKGAKTAAELTGEPMLADVVLEPAAAALEVLQFFETNQNGTVNRSFSDTLPGASSVEMHVIPATPERQYITLFTTGVSSAAAEPTAEYAVAEFYMLLPPDWQIDDDLNADWNWPLLWLQKIGNHTIEHGDWPALPVAFVANEEPPEQLAPNTQLSCLMTTANKSFVRSDGKTVHLHQVVPIYASEREYELVHGLPALMQAFDRADVPFVVDITRPPAV